MRDGNHTGAARVGRLDRLLPMLEIDPENLSLLSDAAEAALEEHRPDVATELLGRYSKVATLPDQEINLSGLAALQMKQFAKASSFFEQLFKSGEADSALRFNLAWARAMQRDLDGALELLDEEAAVELPQAAMLKVQILHERGEFERAAEQARQYIELHPHHPGLLAAVSVLSLDLEDADLAATCAVKAGDHPDALTTLGTLALGEERASEALEMFDEALNRNQNVPRAWVGRGLAKLLSGNADTAPADIDRGAELFRTHIGSWIAAGWAYFVNGDLRSSRARFETALQIDPNFAETHGSLAVLDIVEGRTEEGRQRSEVAIRLNRACYSGALARALLASGAGDDAEARSIFDIAVSTPVDGRGRTISQALAKIGMGTG